MNKMINILKPDEQRKERILHATKKVAQLRYALDEAIDELLKEVVLEN